MQQVVMGIACSLTEAEVVLFLLERAGLSANAVSIVFPDALRARDYLRDHRNIGSFIGAGPLLTPLDGTALDLAAALEHVGVVETEARRFEDEIRDGNILVVVHVASRPIGRMAHAILERGGLRSIVATRTLPATDAAPPSVNAEVFVN